MCIRDRKGGGRGLAFYGAFDDMHPGAEIVAPEQRGGQADQAAADDDPQILVRKDALEELPRLVQDLSLLHI